MDFGMSSFWFGIAAGVVITLVVLYMWATADNAYHEYQRTKRDAKAYREQFRR